MTRPSFALAVELRDRLGISKRHALELARLIQVDRAAVLRVLDEHLGYDSTVIIRRS